MKKLMLGAATAAALLTAAPAMAAGFYIGPGGVGVDVGPGPGCGYWNNWCNGPYSGYYDYYGGPSVVIGGGGWHGHPHYYHRHWHR